MTNDVYLFSNGLQYADWSANNCDRCAKAGDPGEAGSSQCEIFEAIHDAAMDDGSVTNDIARRSGFLEGLHAYVWPCREYVAAYRSAGEAP